MGWRGDKTPPRERGATTRRPPARTPPTPRKRASATSNNRPARQPRRWALPRWNNAWLGRHYTEAGASLGRLLAQPGATAMAWLAIAIALALPAGLYLVLHNLTGLSTDWDKGARLSLYLPVATEQAVINDLQAQLQRDPRLAEVAYISPQTALDEFKQVSGFGDVLDALSVNPLPPVLVLELAEGFAEADQASLLQQELQAMPQVELAQLDLQWVQRLQAITALGQRFILVLAVLLGCGVLLITANTVRLALASRRDEIVVMKLVGATDAFVRRPFLYAGFWYGLGGGVLAWVLVYVAAFFLSGPVASLAGLYASQFQVSLLGWGGSLALWLLGAVLGWLGAAAAVMRHLDDIEPR